MINSWDDRKQNALNLIANDINWYVEPKSDGKYVMTLNFFPSPAFPEKGVEFPEVAFSFNSEEEFLQGRDRHYKSTAMYYTMVAVGESIVNSQTLRKLGLVRILETEFLPVSKDEAIPFTRLGRIIRKNGKFSFSKAKHESFYEKTEHTPSGVKTVEIFAGKKKASESV